MALTKFGGATNTIQSLSDQPNQSDGLTAAQLKLKFDQHAIDTETYLNDTLTVELDANFATKAEVVKTTADQTIEGVKTFLSSPIVPTPTTSGQTATKGYVDSTTAGVVLGQIPDGAITDAKLSNSGIKSTVASHLVDNLYQTAGGTATAITLTIGETLTDGLPVNFKCSANNSGTATTINTKPFYKPGGTSAPNLISGKYYTAVYNLAGDCFFLKASAEGDAVVGDVLAGKKFSNDSDTGLTGTMPNKVGSATVITPTDTDQVIPQGYYGGVAGDGKVSKIKTTAGANYILKQSPGASSSSTTYAKTYEVQAGYDGILRVKFDIFAAASTTAYGRIYVNGVAVGTERSTTSTTAVTYTEDVTVNKNDLVQIYVKKSGTGNMTYQNFWISIAEIPFVYI